MSISNRNYNSLYIRSRILKQLNKLEEAYDTVKKAINIKTTKSLLKDLEELEEKLGIQKKIIMDVLSEKSENAQEENETEKKESFFKSILNMIILLGKHLYNKKKYILFLLLALLFLISKNKIKYSFVKFINY